VKVLDLNLLLYAVNRDSPHHARARRWLEATLSADEPVGLPWVVILGFLRLATSDRVLSRPLKTRQAIELVHGWLAQTIVVPVGPGDHHWSILRALLDETGTAGNLTTDAHLAALAIERGAELCSTDADFTRFPSVRWVNPIAGNP
jgi:toxin-antitoxin system PIN domain toxin